MEEIFKVIEEQNIDTFTMNGELLLTILSSVAQQEVENTSAPVSYTHLTLPTNREV